MNRSRALSRLSCVFAFLGVPSLVHAQQEVFVGDSTNDKIWRLEDTNHDGDLNDVGETTAFFDPALGGFALQLGVGVSTAPDGTVYVSDTGEDVVYAFRDLNGDLDANDVGEARIHFDGRAGANADGVLMNSANSIYFDSSDGSVWVANAASGVVGSVDEIYRLRDLNADGDCNDLGEAARYWTAPAGLGSDYVPVAVIRDPSGTVLFVDDHTTPTGTAGGVFALTDLNADGDAQDAGEYTPYFVPPVAAAQTWSIDRDAAGWYYMNDQTQDVIWRFKDLNADGDAQDTGEFSIWYSAGVASIQWDVAVADDGTVYTCEQSPVKRVWSMKDLDANGVIGAGELTESYNATISATVIGNLRGIALGSDPFVGTTYCFGDGAGTACPCANNSAVGDKVGCLSSLGTGGKLRAIGAATVGSDTIKLQGSQVPNGPGLYFQGTVQLNAGNGVVFGDGLRCAGGSIIRLAVISGVANASQYPRIGIDQPVSVQGFCAPGDVRHYQLWYRDSDPVFCSAAVFNLTNALTLTWN